MSAGGAARNPFPGLRPFEAKDSTLFFGRDEQIGEALERLLRERLLAVVGVSGGGKSSLVAAGMVPAVQMGLAGDPHQRWHVATMRPGDGPLGELGRCLGFGGGALVERTYGLLEAVETHLPAGDNLFLVVDQFEEIFPLRDRKLRERAGSEADLFVSYLLRAAQVQSGRVYVVLTMRSDYLGECAKFHGLPEALNDGQYLVPRMSRQQLREAIEGPLAAAGVEIHPALVQDLLNQSDEEPDNLPLLQHLLRRMFEQWEEDGGKGSITAATAKKVGGLAEALDQDAETVYGKLAPGEQLIAELVFRGITESRQSDRGGEDRPVRRPRRAEDLARLARVSEAALRNVTQRFEDRGLLVVRQTDEGDKVDLPHECLCLKWRRLKKWIRSEAEDAKKLRFLLDAVGKSYLTGLALAESLEWQRGGRLESEWCLRYLNGEQKSAVVTWVKESERLVEEAAEKDRRQQEKELQHAKERSRRARRTAAFLGVAFLAAAAFGWEAIVQKGKAENQKGAAENQRAEAKRQENQAIIARKAAEAARNQAENQRAEATRQENRAIIAREEAEAARRQADASFKQADERLHEAELGLAAADEKLESDNRIKELRACIAATDRISKGLEPVASREFFAGRWHAVTGTSSQVFMDWRLDGVCDFKAVTTGGQSRDMTGKRCTWTFKKISNDEFVVNTDLKEPGFIGQDLKFKIINYNRIHNIDADYFAYRITCPDDEIRLFTKELEDRQQLAKADPGNPERERAVALSYNYVGDALRARGNTKWSSDNNGARADTHEALSDYRNAMSIIGELVKRQPNNSNWQHDRVDCYDRIGSVSTNLGAALDAYKSGLAIMLRLAAANQRNVDWQHQLALEYNNIGGLLAYENNRRDALRNYEQNRRIITKLAESQPGVTEWQKELAVEEFWISKVSDEPAARKAALDSALAIANTLARNHKLPHDLQTLPYEIRDELSKLQSSGK
jgi:hypothetical protein